MNKAALKKTAQLLACLAMTSSMLALPAAVSAQTSKAKPAVKSKSKATKTAEAPATPDEDDVTPEIGQSKVFEYKCELGNALTMYTNADDVQHIGMRWKKHLYRLTRVETTTGAQRFENKKAGFVWIGIPAKALLLDSKHGQQLANECKTDTPPASQDAPAPVSALPAVQTSQQGS